MNTAFLALTVLSATLALAQPPQRMNPETRLTQTLGLTAEQQNKLHTLFAEQRLTMQPNRTQMESLHTSLTAAIKTGDEAQIDKLTQQISAIQQQESAAHAKTTAKIYGMLSADQRAKVDANLGMLMGAGHPGPRRSGPPPAQQQ